MIMTELEAVASGVLPVSAFADHLRLGTGFADDGSEDVILESYLRAALAAIEAQTGKAILERRFSVSVTNWRRGYWQGLPLAPVKNIESVTIFDAADTATPVDPTDYTLQPDTHRPKICSTKSVLPGIPPNGNAEIVVLAGYGAGWSGVPVDLQQAVLILAANYFEHRHGVSDSGATPASVEALIGRYRPIGFGGVGA